MRLTAPSRIFWACEYNTFVTSHSLGRVVTFCAHPVAHMHNPAQSQEPHTSGLS